MPIGGQTCLSWRGFCRFGFYSRRFSRVMDSLPETDTPFQKSWVQRPCGGLKNNLLSGQGADGQFLSPAKNQEPSNRLRRGL